MNKIKQLMMEAPSKILEQAEHRVYANQVSRLFTLLFDYEKANKVSEFSRVSNKLEDCVNRLQVIFDAVDKMVARGGNKEVALEFKKLLLLASTPDESEQAKVQVLYEEPVVMLSSIVTEEEAVTIGTMSYWSQ